MIEWIGVGVIGLGSVAARFHLPRNHGAPELIPIGVADLSVEKQAREEQTFPLRERLK